MIYLIIILIFVAIKYFLVTAPFVPVHRVDLPRFAELVKKYRIKNLVDLGCGAGGVLNHLSRVYPERKFIGMEIALWSYFVCRMRFLFSKNVKIIYGNFFWLDWSKYDTVFLFWIDRTIARYQKEMTRKLKPGQFVISYAFEIPWLCDKLLEKDTAENHLPIYVYRY
jgi:hypothetical protein